MIQVLKAINEEMESLKIPYEFDKWKSKIRLPYFVGEISEDVNDFEDGKRTFDFILTGEDNGTYTKLFCFCEALKSRYKYGHKISFDNGLMIMVYNNMLTIPVEDEDLKRIQINITITLWEDE